MRTSEVIHRLKGFGYMLRRVNDNQQYVEVCTDDWYAHPYLAGNITQRDYGVCQDYAYKTEYYDTLRTALHALYHEVIKHKLNI